MRALITGASGFVGGHLSHYLHSIGWEVFGFDLRAGAAENRFIQGELTDGSKLEQVLDDVNPDAIFHLAGIIKSLQSVSLYKANLLGTIVLLDKIMESDRRPVVVVAGSSAVYGNKSGQKKINEKMQLHPITHYAVSKASQEIASLRYYEAFGLPVMIVRMFNLLGPGQSPDLACSAFARQIALAEISTQNEIVTGNLEAKRDFVDVRDAVRAFALLAENGEAGQTYNVCSGRAVAIQQCLREMMSQSQKQLSVRIDAARVQKNDVPVQVGSFQKLQKVTGWNPRIPLKESLSDLLDDWRERIKLESK